MKTTLEYGLSLKWLFYIAIVSTVAIIGFRTGYLQLFFEYDFTYIMYVICATFVVGELYIAKHIYYTDKELLKVKEAENLTDTKFENLPEGLLKDHIANIKELKKNKKGDINQRALLENMTSNVTKSHMSTFTGEILMRLGLLGTLGGLIISLWPWVEKSLISAEATFTKAMILEIVVNLFQGLSTAFLTTIAGLILGTLIVISGKILQSGTDQLVSRITVLSETKIIPRLDDEE